MCHVKPLRTWKGQGKGEVNIYQSTSRCQALPHTFSHLILLQYISSFFYKNTHPLALERLCNQPKMTKHPFYSHSTILCCSVSVYVIRTSEHKLDTGAKKENQESFLTLRHRGGEGRGRVECRPRRRKPTAQGAFRRSPKSSAIHGNLKQ